MPSPQFNARRDRLITKFNDLIEQPNAPDTAWDNGIFERYVNPVITAAHTPLTWRYDFNPTTNPFLIERMAVNGTLNPGAILLDGMVYLMVRVEGVDRKSFFAVAESPSGTDCFRFWDEPIFLPETDIPDTNVYDMRLTAHEDGWIYGVFCTERKDTSAAPGDTSSAVAQAGIARTKDLRNWDRLPDLRTPSAQQRNAVLHPEFVDGCYAFYTRPQDGFIDAGSGGGIGWGLSERMNPAVIEREIIVDARVYHTIKEAKNGQGPAPIKIARGWLHLAHGVRNCAAGLRYVLYMFMTDLHEPWRVTHSPGGYFLAPEGHERAGDVSNVAFCNGWIARPNGDVCIYYASSDTRCHVATTTVEKLVDYVTNTPPDGLRSAAVVEQRIELARRNLAFDPSLRGM